MVDRRGVPEIRIDPLSGHKTIVAGERSRRPGGEPGCAAPPEPIDPESDPFAEGHEDRTPPELYAVRPGGGPPDSPGWTVRVIPNLYPALTPRGIGGRRSRGRRPAPELFRSLPATGAHEVIVNGPQPVLSLAELPRRAGGGRDGGLARAACASTLRRVRAADRQRAPRPGPRCRTPTAQLYALDFVPAAVARERERAPMPRDTMGQSLLGDLVAEEVRRRERIVAIDEEAVLMAPYASRLPFQLMLAPRTPRARFEDDGPSRRGAPARRAVPPGPPLRLEPAVEHVGAHGSARGGALLLADRRAAAPDPSGGPRAVHRT